MENVGSFSILGLRPKPNRDLVNNIHLLVDVTVILDLNTFWYWYSQFQTEHGEGLQILHYEVGQKYDAHYDYFVDEYNIKKGGQRMATLLMYL